MNIVSRMNINLRHILHNHGNIVTEVRPKSGLYSTLIEWLQGFLIVHSTIDNTAHSRPLNSWPFTYLQLWHFFISYFFCTCFYAARIGHTKTAYIGGSNSNHYYPTNLNSLGHGNYVCTKKIYRPTGTLPMPWRCPPDIPYTWRPPIGSR